jgi:hypothetical protein
MLRRFSSEFAELVDFSVVPEAITTLIDFKTKYSSLGKTFNIILGETACWN